MKQRAVEVLFKHKLLILLPLVVILPLTVMTATRPQAKQWQAFATVWVDEYKSFYEDERLGVTPAMNQAELLNSFIRTRSFAHTVLRQTQMAPLVDNPRTERGATRRFWSSVRATPTSKSFVMISVTMPGPQLAHETAQAVMTSFSEALQSRKETQGQTATAF